MPRTTGVKAATVTTLRSMPAAEALSFLRETRGVPTWTARDMAHSLRISLADAAQVISILQLQGYVKPAEGNEWMTTLAGETVSESKIPRYKPERVEQALQDLGRRIGEVNRDARAPYRIAEAVAFGDFLAGRARAQAAVVGVRLAQRKSGDAAPDSAEERNAQQAFLKLLQPRGGVLRLAHFEEWMRERAHRRIL